MQKANSGPVQGSVSGHVTSSCPGWVWPRGEVVSALGLEAGKLSRSRHLGAAAKRGDYPPTTHSVQAENRGWRLQLSMWVVKPPGLSALQGEPGAHLTSSRGKCQVSPVWSFTGNRPPPGLGSCGFPDSEVRGLKLGVS